MSRAQLPAGWSMTFLGDVCRYGECENIDPKDIPAGAWLLGLEDIEKDTGRIIARKNIEDAKSASTKHRFNKGQVLYSKLRPYLNKVLIADDDGYCTSEILPLAFNEGVDPNYACYYMKSPVFLSYAVHHSYGTRMPRLGINDGRRAPFPLPPLSEQRRIVARIEALFSDLDHGVATLRETKRLLELYRQSVLKEAFEKFSEWKPLEQICTRIFDGPFGSNLKSVDYISAGIRVVRLENIKAGRFDDSKRSFVSEEKYETIKIHTVYPTDLIMSTFAAENIKVCQLPESIPFAVNKADCVGIRLTETFVPKYILYYLSSRKAYEQLVHHVHGATRPRLNTTQIKNTLVPICDIEKQRNVVSYIDSRLSVCSQIEQTVDAALQKSDALRQSILKQAFEGKL